MKQDEFGLEAPPAGLYEFSAEIGAGIDGFAKVTDADIEAFHTLGFMVIHNAIDRAAIEAGRAAIHDLILSHDNDNIMVESVVGERFFELPDEERLDSVRKMMPVVPFDTRMQAASENAALLDLLGRIMGERADLSQDQAMLKPPRIGREKPWHQDMAYFDYPTETTIVGAWIALDEASAENGCMMVIPGSHRDGPMPHWTRRDWQICDTDVRLGEIAAVPLPPGGCLLFHCLLHHGTPPTRSNRRRWALQFHYCPASVNRLPNSDQRLSVFGTDGLEVTC
ncbi:MAG: phytanoyl-CoA dioxygenase family protein [Chloroflexota bacterium]|nr:phytanoyl-CoA dioxygenase family protein [Chloroflexota bacterium]MDE2909716.1 phytanoyl-CoA dioxygenase family protein [Chloroflexota bacterium]